MKNALFLVLFFSLSVFSSTSKSQDFFIDYENGNDQNSGKSIHSAWKHIPWDENATSKAIIKPGDRFIFKGGVVYRGAIDIQTSGSAQQPIKLIGNQWGRKPAILSGSTKEETTIKKCQSRKSCLDLENWEQISTAQIERAPQEESSIVIENQNYWMARTPNNPNNFWYDDLEHYYQTDKAVDTESPNKILDLDIYNKLKGKSLFGAKIALRLNPNLIYTYSINELQDKKVVLNKNIGVPHKNQPTHYMLLNRPSDLDKKNEFIYSENEKLIAFHYSHNKPPHKSRKITIETPTRGYGININGKSNISIEGFIFENFIGHEKEWTSGSGVINKAHNSHSVEIKDNIFRRINSKQRSGLLHIRYVKNYQINNNTFQDSYNNYGIKIGSSSDISIKDNLITNLGSTGITSIKGKNIHIQGNDFNNLKGIHGNGISIYLLNNKINIIDNTIKTDRAITFHGDRKHPTNQLDLKITGNIIYGSIYSWGQNTSSVVIKGNFIKPKKKNRAINLHKTDKKISVINNQLLGLPLKRFNPNWVFKGNTL